MSHCCGGDQTTANLGCPNDDHSPLIKHAKVEVEEGGIMKGYCIVCRIMGQVNQKILL
jgi:hypothetical protein